jgi:hypothetical protein
VKKYGRDRQDTDDNTLWHMCIVCWKTEATDTQSEYVIGIAFPRQQSSCKHASVLRHYVHSIVLFVCVSAHTANFAVENVNWLEFTTELKSAFCAVQNSSFDETVTFLSITRTHKLL